MYILPENWLKRETFNELKILIHILPHKKIVRIQFIMNKINLGLLNQHIPYADSTLHRFLEV